MSFLKMAMEVKAPNVLNQAYKESQNLVLDHSHQKDSLQEWYITQVNHMRWQAIEWSKISHTRYCLLRNQISTPETTSSYH